MTYHLSGNNFTSSQHLKESIYNKKSSDELSPLINTTNAETDITSLVPLPHFHFRYSKSRQWPHDDHESPIALLKAYVNPANV